MVFDDVHDPYWEQEAMRLKADKQKQRQVYQDLREEGHAVPTREKRKPSKYAEYIDCIDCGDEILKMAHNHKRCRECYSINLLTSAKARRERAKQA